MGSYLFSTCEVGELKSEHDLNTLKHISTSADYLSFELTEQNDDLIKYTLEFFKYLYQKSPFTLKLHQIKANIKLNIFNGPENNYLMLLYIEQYVNKYIICRKFNNQKRDLRISSKSLSANVYNIIKLNFRDVIYRIKGIKLKESHHHKIMHYFGMMCLTDCYHNELIKDFYMNSKYVDIYDHLLPCYFMREAYDTFIDYFPKFLLKHCVTNVKLAPLILRNISNDSNMTKRNSLFTQEFNDDNAESQPIQDDNDYIIKLFDSIESNRQLTFVDLSFIIYINSIEEIYTKIKYIVTKLPKKNDISFDYIIRFYIWSRVNLYAKLSQCKTQFKKAISRVPNKKNSVIMMNIFKEEIIKCDISPCNPRVSDELLQKSIDIREEEYNQLKETPEWLNRNRSEIPYDRKYTNLIISKSFFRIYTNTQYQAISLLNALYTNNPIIKKLRPKTIISEITKFLSINLITEECKPRKQREFVLKRHYDNQIENVIPIVKSPKSNDQLNYDLIHCHFDHIYNILNKNIQDMTL